MTNIYDKAHEFADVLKDIPEVVAYREASKKISENPELKKMVADFRKIQIEAYNEQMQTGTISDATKEKMQKVGGVVMINPAVAAYLQSEAQFAVIWEDLLKILNEAIGVDIIAPNS
ncbi:YlbF family regulator [Clostridium sp. C8-1-8]|uniref:YlbF family regulator n=1 Tax=Clostridium sp. C8-1-8 TaxID=2698831 RepID=UPI00136C6C7F|nr:YlbF family regulator [Clostridium sp. C8-1-8]